jgi:excinuclease ABC subunit A
MESYFKQIEQGFLKVRGTHVIDITSGMKLDRYKTHDIEIVVDRMVVEPTADNETLEQKAYRYASW